MAQIATESNKRDFLANEITKRIVGPGFAQDVYECQADASDEILTERPQVVYTSGILFPKEEQDNQTASTSPQNQAAEVITSNLFGDPYGKLDPDSEQPSDDEEDAVEETGEDATKTSLFASSEDMENGLSDERAGFKPDIIGLITCLKSNTPSVVIYIDYGRYHLLPESEWERNVKVKLGDKCPIAVLRKTFDYYNVQAQELLKSLGVGSVYDLFNIDTINNTISPKRELSFQVLTADNETVTKNVYASSFPALPQNKAAAIVMKLLSGEEKEIELKTINWEELQSYINLFDSSQNIKDILVRVGWTSLLSHIAYDSASNRVRLINGPFRSGDLNFAKYLFVYDPVREYVLDKLLEYRYFKRETCSVSVTLDLSKDFGKEDLGDGMFLHWKAFYYRKNTAKRYLRILLQNCKIVQPKSGDIPHAFQTVIRLESNGILSYSEPQVSSIDEEFNLNEVLYSDEVVFGKGVNCAVSWESTEEGTPKWIKTTYAPSTIVRSFSTKPDNNVTVMDNICRVHNLSIWGLSDTDIISGLRAFAGYYLDWMKEQQLRSHGDTALNSILDNQKEFYDRLVDNIDYLEATPRAFQCFRLANTAMYIQMLLGRDQKFKQKGRDKSEYTAGDLFFKDCWDYFNDSSLPSENPSFYPFQLAFLIMNVKSTFESNDPYRTEKVDLIWFPTGGGKTEAYLALTALTIAERRTSGHLNTSGVSVIMRYTLRLLTAQQFERASYLICALEYLRQHFINNPVDGYSLGDIPITLGMWIGQSATPNKISDLSLQDKFKAFFTSQSKENNPFPVVYCPWCGCELVGDDRTIGYDRGRSGRRLDDICLNDGCHFHTGLPIYYVDEQLYNNPPTLLFATVDKFAQLTTKTAGSLFGVGTDRRKPDLIIQDELHLISGPLGSLVGLFESLVEELSTEKDRNGIIVRSPKIIASTATTRNTKQLIKQLYERDVVTFPASGIRYDNNFFSHVVSVKESKRLYLGLSPTGHSSSELEIRTIASELVAKEKLITEWLSSKGVPLDESSIYNAICPDGKLIEELDLYWTQVLYYINLKSLGRTHSRFSQEIKATVENIRRFSATYPQLSFILDGFYTRNTEFTSRQNSAQIKRLLIKADEPTIIEKPQPDVLRIESQMDVVQATNMISVGIDIDRWNVMMMVGQPLTTSVYIQASSRAGRHHQGLIVNIFNSLRSRELSYYENYTSYHQVFYKYVEPLSATSFTEMTLDKLIINLFVGYMVLIKDKNLLVDVTLSDKIDFVNWMALRANAVGVQSSLLSSLSLIVDDVYKKLQSIDTPTHHYSFSDIVTKPMLLSEKNIPHLMKSLRDVEQNTYLNYE